MKSKLLLLATLFFSCQKDEIKPSARFCWKCTFTVSSQGHSGSSSATYCDLTKQEIEQAKERGIRAASGGGMTATGSCHIKL